jgi:hypothetical protein
VSFSAGADPAEEFVPLFNGTDLTGWQVVGADAFTVKEGAIYTTGKSPYPSWLRTDEMYENFILRFEYNTEGWYEGGFLFHAPLDGPVSRMGLKLHLKHDPKAYGVRSAGALYDAVAPSAIPIKKSGEWNQCEIECDWPRLKVRINDVTIHDLDMDTHPALRHRMRRGYLGIQNVGCHASFRNLVIKALPNKETWEPLFAQGLDGLNTVEETTWTVENEILTGDGKLGYAISKKKYTSPYELQVWAKTQTNGNGGVLFNYRGSQQHGYEIQVFNTPDSTNPTGSIYDIAQAERVVTRDGEWNLIQLIQLGKRALVYVNGEKVTETDELADVIDGHIAFQQHTPGLGLQYKGARIKAIDPSVWE